MSLDVGGSAANYDRSLVGPGILVGAFSSACDTYRFLWS